MYRRYYSYSDMPEPIKVASKPQCVEENIIEQSPLVHSQEKNCSENDKGNKILGKFDIDDVLLLVVAVILIMDECDDKLLLVAIGFIFLTGFFEK